jgi:hypothetical protein
MALESDTDSSGVRSPPRANSSISIESTEGDAGCQLEAFLSSPRWIVLCGVLRSAGHSPFCQRGLWLYCVAVHLLVLLSAAFSAWQLFSARVTPCEDGTFLQFVPLCDFVLALGSFLSLLVFRAITDTDILGSAEAVLVNYARRRGVTQQWYVAARSQFRLLATSWIAVAVLRGTYAYYASEPGTYSDLRPPAAQALSFVFASVSSFVFMGMSYSILHVSEGISQMIDTYCAQFAKGRDVQTNVSEWNKLQAIWRRASRALEKGFLVIQTTVLLLGVSILLLASASSSQVLILCSIGLLAVSAALIFFKAAEVTERCVRVPSFINSYTFGHDVDPSRHFLIEYVTYSAAGFYVREIRLTAAMAMKFTYVAGLIIFGLLTRVPSSD